MQRKFLINLLLFLGLNLLIKPFWIFGIDRSVQNTVGEEIYGIYFALFNFSLLFNMLLDFGITSLNNRNVARSSDFLKENFSRIFALKLILGLFYIFFVLAVGCIKKIGYTTVHFELLLFLIINQFLAGFILFLRSNVSGLLLFKTDSFLSVIDRLIMIICCSILLWGGITKTPFQIEWFVYVQTFAYLVTIFIALPIVLSHTRLRSPFVDYAYFKNILKQSLPFALLALFTSLHNRMDSVFLERLLPNGASQSGIYASAFRLLDAAMIIAYLFSVLLLPMFSKMIAKKESVIGLLRTAFSLIFIYGITLAVASFFYSDPLMNLLYHNHIDQSSEVFSILMLSIAPLSATYIFGSLLTAKGELKKLNLIAITAIIINVGLNLLLIFKWQALGSAVASLCTQLFIITAEIILAVRLFKIRLSKSYCLKWLGFIFLSIFAGKISLLLPFIWQKQFLFMLLFLGIVSVVFEWKQVKYLIMSVKLNRNN